MDIPEIRPVTLETSPSGQLYPRASGRNLGQRAIEIWRGAGSANRPIWPAANPDGFEDCRYQGRRNVAG